jgi:hypothetical protein
MKNSLYDPYNIMSSLLVGDRPLIRKKLWLHVLYKVRPPHFFQFKYSVLVPKVLSDQITMGLIFWIVETEN